MQEDVVQQELTQEIRLHAQSLGADVVGFAPVDRWAKAPIEHSPRGIFPSSKTAIVCGVHFLDACTELGTTPDVRVPGPALGEMTASICLEMIGYQLSRFIQQRGHGVLYVPQSGGWAYRPRSGAPRGWMADIVSYYAAVCAGLGEIGWNNLCLHPVYGPRVRYVTIITDAVLEPTPLYRGPALCDRCKLCVKHCPSQTYTTDRPDAMLSIEVEDRRFEFPDRNLWRCAIGENFNLDVLLPFWKDRHVDEAAIAEVAEQAVHEHPEWIFGWKMGQCLKHCVPPQRRYFDRTYSNAPRRRRDVTPAPGPRTAQAILRDVRELAQRFDVDVVGVAPASALAAVGVELKAHMPDAASAIVLGMEYPENCYLTTRELGRRAELYIAKHIQEVYGFSAIVQTSLDPALAAQAAGLEAPSPNSGRDMEFYLV